ncbi:hypothetical protein PV325_005169 [Microctonus aethiopoides]|nr:hypothetical protein PV325_005169 [Microctonus aethiopoides]KAK0084185.1 hypothetical protein PV326_006378 [Microctonus aethiopoides]
MSAGKKKINGRSYAWRLTRAEVEAKMAPYSIRYDPNATVQNLKRLLSQDLKQVQSESLIQASANNTLRQVEAEIHHSRDNKDEIRSLVPSRPASPPQPSAIELLLQSTQLIRPDSPKREPEPSLKIRKPLRTRHF